MKNRNRIIITLSIILLVVAFTALIVGFVLAGNDVIAWLGSKWAIWLYTFIGVYIVIVIGILIAERIKRL